MVSVTSHRRARMMRFTPASCRRRAGFRRFRGRSGRVSRRPSGGRDLDAVPNVLRDFGDPSPHEPSEIDITVSPDPLRARDAPRFRRACRSARFTHRHIPCLSDLLSLAVASHSARARDGSSRSWSLRGSVVSAKPSWVARGRAAARRTPSTMNPTGREDTIDTAPTSHVGAELQRCRGEAEGCR